MVRVSDESDRSDLPARRTFLNVAIAGTAGALGLAAGYPVTRFLAPTAAASPKRVEVAKLDEFPIGTSKSLAYGDRAALVIRLADGSFRAFVAICTHLQCVVRYSPERNRIECPCHDGIFSVDGENIAGPPPRPLQALRVTVLGGVVMLGEA